MTEQQSADQLRPDEEINKPNQPGSQSSSGMSNRVDDQLVEAMERDKLRRGEPLDVTPEGLGNDARPESPIGRSPEAATGPIQD